MVKLCLGSANFGFKYGLVNKKINPNKLLKILSLAKKSNVLNIDTSFEYHNSHRNLKKSINSKMNIHTKIFINKNLNLTSLKKKINNFNSNSPSQIYSILLHDQNDALSVKKVKLLKRLKDEGIVNKIGVSIYDLYILKKILKLWTPDIVQVPVNPFNLDFVSKDFLNDLKRKKITIFARSIFLQGILLRKYNILAKKYKKDLEDWFNFCESKTIHPVKACLDFCKSIKEIDYLVIGVQDAEELKQIIKFFKQPIKLSSKLIIDKKYKKIDLRKI